MKKIVKIAILLIVAISLCACSKEKYGLIEITTEELANNLFDTESGSFILAFYNEDQNNYKPFIEDLEYIAESNYKNVYMMNLKYIRHSDELYMYMFFGENVDMNSYLINDKGNIIVYENYINNDLLRKNMMKLPENDTFERINDETKKTSIRDAEKYLKDGEIAKSYNEILKASTLKEGKEFINENQDKYSLLNNWISKEKNSKKTYDYIRFSHIDPVYEKTITKDKDAKKIDSNSKKTVYFKLVDDIIYTCDTKDGEYIGSFKIMKITNDDLTLKNLKTNKETEYIRRVDLDEE